MSNFPLSRIFGSTKLVFPTMEEHLPTVKRFDSATHFDQCSVLLNIRFLRQLKNGFYNLKKKPPALFLFEFFIEVVNSREHPEPA